MASRSFGENLSERIERLCSKYSNIDDLEDDHIDILKMNIVKDSGKAMTNKKISIGTLFKKSYLRNRDIKIVRTNFENTSQHFNDLYDSIFKKSDFNSLYKKLITKNEL